MTLPPAPPLETTTTPPVPWPAAPSPPLPMTTTPAVPPVSGTVCPPLPPLAVVTWPPVPTPPVPKWTDEPPPVPPEMPPLPSSVGVCPPLAAGCVTPDERPERSSSQPIQQVRTSTAPVDRMLARDNTDAAEGRLD